MTAGAGAYRCTTHLTQVLLPSGHYPALNLSCCSCCYHCCCPCFCCFKCSHGTHDKHPLRGRGMGGGWEGDSKGEE